MTLIKSFDRSADGKRIVISTLDQNGNPTGPVVVHTALTAQNRDRQIDKQIAALTAEKTELAEKVIAVVGAPTPAPKPATPAAPAK